MISPNVECNCLTKSFGRCTAPPLKMVKSIDPSLLSQTAYKTLDSSNPVRYDLSSSHGRMVRISSSAGWFMFWEAAALVTLLWVHIRIKARGKRDSRFKYIDPVIRELFFIKADKLCKKSIRQKFIFLFWHGIGSFRLGWFMFLDDTMRRDYPKWIIFVKKKMHYGIFFI